MTENVRLHESNKKYGSSGFEEWSDLNVEFQWLKYHGIIDGLKLMALTLKVHFINASKQFYHTYASKRRICKINSKFHTVHCIVVLRNCMFFCHLKMYYRPKA